MKCLLILFALLICIPISADAFHGRGGCGLLGGVRERHQNRVERRQGRREGRQEARQLAGGCASGK